MIIRIKNYGEVEIEDSKTLLLNLIENHIRIDNICNGKGTCSKCKVRFIQGVPEATPADLRYLSTEELEEGIRLACQVKPQKGMEIDVNLPNSFDRKNTVLRRDDQITLDPGLKGIFLTIPQPSLEDERGDWDRIVDEYRKVMPEQSLALPSLGVLERLPRILREQNYRITVVTWQNRVIDIQSGDGAALHGLAIDIGTTSVAVALINLKTAEVLGSVSTENGQTAFGGDVISRIAYAGEGVKNRLQLTEAVRSTINTLIDGLVHQHKIARKSIYKMTIVSNTTMSHLFLGLDVSNLAVSPYVSVYNQALEFFAQDLGLGSNPEAVVQILPNIGSFVGGDTVGALIGAPEVLAQGNHLLLDLGTNCELVLKTEKMMLACSTAAGPAFEGAGIFHGMRAKPGAIEGIKISEEGVELKVIGDEEALGICGSGLIDGIAQMRQAGIINRKGAFVDPAHKDCSLSDELKSRVCKKEDYWEFVFAFGQQNKKDISLGQRDIEALQLAKGAVCAGIKTLVSLAGISLQDLDSIVMAGTFATYLKKESILSIGLTPHTDPEKIKMAGNAAHLGAIRALLNQGTFAEGAELARRIRHVELGGDKTFTSFFMRSMYLEPTLP
ncbi:ASKHA domain-containing protein [Desulfitobacterium sp. PCE1]|uniref:ASKHA domain-containing protein n=1 Tax=Desulfitobacterium sp. PCE1 TaxID=146907 RepID=UPI00037FF150|nr:ASKHA domain-containing protein [Desulfitobacterium sp. PCE1]